MNTIDNVNNTVCNLEMPQEIKTKWLEALRSGQYQQEGGSLCTSTYDSTGKTLTVGYCCLGVLMEVVDGENVFESWSDEDGTLPINDWYNKHGMRSFYAKQTPDITGLNLDSIRNDSVLYYRNDGYSTYEVKPYMDHPQPVADGYVHPASFLEIADFIEQNVKGL
jgi:hypothetical protein